VDAFITVVEPGMRSLETAQVVKKLAEDIGIKKIYIVGNKIADDADRQFIVDNLADFTVLGFISQNPRIVEADRKGISPYDLDPKVVSEVKAIKEKLATIQT
jgi:CO dehydrogenase maturation factor